MRYLPLRGTGTAAGMAALRAMRARERKERMVGACMVGLVEGGD